MNDWHYLTWQEIQQKVESGLTSALLPVGATEQHGPHLGCGVDTSIAEKTCHAVASNTETVLLPTLPYGCSIGHSKRWPGTLALQPKTLIDVVTEIGDWVYSAGIRKIFIINSHVTNFAPLRCALEMLRAKYDDIMIALINTPEISPRVRKSHFSDAEDWHANDAETSLMLAIDFNMVRPDKCSSSDDEDRTTNKVFAHPVNRTSSNGVTGSPSLATKAKGDSLFENMVEDLTQLINSGIEETPPLTASYFESVLEP